MSPTGVDKLHEDFTTLIALLDAQNEPSLRTSADDIFRRTLLLAAASFFESRIVQCVLDFAEEITRSDGMITEFIRIKAIERQYHSWFSWKDKNANSFFALFGSEFKSFMKRKLAGDEELESAISAFMEIGRDRNRLVHENFAAFSLEKTSDEIYKSYKSALYFVNTMPQLLRECSALNAETGNARENSQSPAMSKAGV
jgi:hypothetical protein